MKLVVNAFLFVVFLGGKKKTPHSHVTSAHVHPHGNAATSSASKTTRRRLDRSPNKDKKKQDVVGTKQFWEEHNKVGEKERFNFVSLNLRIILDYNGF